MLSVLEFVYLGEAQYYQERMNSLVSFAASLHIKIKRKNVETNQNKVGNKQDKQLSSNDNNGSDESSDGNHFTLSDEELENAPKNLLNDHCIECNKTFTAAGSLGRHIRAVHDKLKFNCPIDGCTFSSAYKQKLRNHKKYSHDDHPRIQCSDCSFKALNTDHLKIHKKAKHEGVRYPCKDCKYEAQQQSALTRHIESMHKGRKYKCLQCNKEYTDSYALKLHIKVQHEGIRHKCTLCDKMFVDKRLVKRHIKVKHKGKGLKK